MVSCCLQLLLFRSLFVVRNKTPAAPSLYCPFYRAAIGDFTSRRRSPKTCHLPSTCCRRPMLTWLRKPSTTTVGVGIAWLNAGNLRLRSHFCIMTEPLVSVVYVCVTARTGHTDTLVSPSETNNHGTTHHRPLRGPMRRYDDIDPGRPRALQPTTRGTATGSV